jgi:Signal transduction histidine kinase
MVKTLKGRISLVYFYLVLVIAMVGLVSVINLFQLSNSINGLMTANYKSIKAVHEMVEYIEHQDHALLLYIRINSRQGFDSFMSNRQLFLNSFRIERYNTTEPGETKLVNQLKTSYQEYLSSFAQLQSIKTQAGVDSAFRFYTVNIRGKFERVKSVLKKLSALNETAMFRHKDQATENALQSMNFILFLSLVAVIGAFVAARFFVNRFLKPVDTLKETVKLVRAGDLNQQAKVFYPDEIGELAAEFNAMTKRLQQYEQSTVGKLMAEKHKSEAIVRNIFDPLVVLDTNYRLLLLNEAAESFFEIHEQDVLGKHFLEVIRNDELFQYITGVYRSAMDDQKKIILIPSQEKDFYFNVLVKLVKGQDVAVNNIIVLFQNITQIKQLEKIKTDFIATVSHEFKTPLTSIMMGISLLRGENLGTLNERQTQTLATIKEDIDSLTNLVNDLLQISKIESDRGIFKIQPCSAIGLVEGSVKKFLDQAARNEIHLNYQVEEDLPKVNADPEKVTWVLNNLISNALKYTNAGDEILVTAFPKQDKMCFVVKDTGTGIPAEYLAKLFDKFVQVKGYDLEVRGTGLGLAIAKEIVEAHGGEIWCESKLDLGSTFTFTLPLTIRRSS